MNTLYGIKNCDTVKKAKSWLEQANLEYRFHDFRVDGLERNQLKHWCDELGWEQLLNKRGTTWRKLPDDLKTEVDEEHAIQLMLDYPAMIKRPLLDTGTQRVLGFKADTYRQIFQSN